MRLRPLGNTGLEVSEIGLGCWQLANPDFGVRGTAESSRIVQAALAAGCNFFDTAPGYGRGASEELLGRELEAVRGEVVICSKFGHTADGATDFRAEAIRPALEASLRRLRTDWLDIVLMHNPPRELLDEATAPQYEEFERLRSEGMIGAYGVSLDRRVELELLRDRTRSDAAEVHFNALYQEPLSAFAAAQARGMGLIVKVPLDSGWLTGKYSADHAFDGVRRRWSPEVRARRSALVKKFAALVPAGTTMAQAALQFVLAQPQVSTVIPGAMSVEQVKSNFAAAQRRLAPQVVQAMRELWAREIEHDPLPW